MNLFTKLFILPCFLLPVSISAQALAQKLPDQQKRETQSHCGSQSFWLKGHWQWNEQIKNYEWVKAHCENYRKGYTYIPGRWTKVAEGWLWQEGIWKKI